MKQGGGGGKNLNGLINHVSLPDPNQNANNFRYQLLVVFLLPSLAHIFLTLVS